MVKYIIKSEIWCNTLWDDHKINTLKSDTAIIDDGWLPELQVIQNIEKYWQAGNEHNARKNCSWQEHLLITLFQVLDHYIQKNVHIK